MIQTALNFPRKAKQAIMLLFDSIALVGILLVSFSTRLGYWYFPEDDLIWVVLGAPILALPIFVFFGLYHSVVRYIGYETLWSVGKAVTLYGLAWGLIAFMVAVEGIPRSVILINWMLCILMIGGARMLARRLLTSPTILSEKGKQNVIIYGAGDAGRQLSKALQYSSEFNHVAFIDDNADKQGSYISGIPVEPLSKLTELIEEKKVSEVLLALPSISRKYRNEIIEALRSVQVQVRSLPRVSELAQGAVKIEDLRHISIKDLLGRDPVEANGDLLKANIEDKVVMITGAGGSIGSELCRQTALLMPRQLILLEVNEFSLYKIDY